MGQGGCISLKKLCRIFSGAFFDTFFTSLLLLFDRRCTLLPRGNNVSDFMSCNIRPRVSLALVQIVVWPCMMPVSASVSSKLLALRYLLYIYAPADS